MAELQDLVVIGGGAAGFAAAMRAAQLGGKVTIVESAHYGGNCMNKACIPLTFLMTAAHTVEHIRNAARFGVRTGQPQVDITVLQDRKDLIIEGLRLGTEQLLADHGITLIVGRARLSAPDTVEVHPSSTAQGQAPIKARNIVIATGSISAQLPIKGMDLPGVLSTEEAVELREIPQRIAVLGNQPWDIELAQYFHLMGSQVTLIAGSEQLLAGADRDIAQRLGKLFYDAGMVIHRRDRVEAIRAQDGALLVVLADGKGEVLVDKVLAARRLSNSAGLGLRELGVKMEGSSVLVNERMETNVPHLYAVGDVTHGPMWSHKANAEGIVCAENAMGQTSRMNYGVLPHCTYTLPQVAWVGLTEEEAETRTETTVGKIPTAFNPQAMILDETAGEIKIIAGKAYGKILGAHMVAPGAVDLINTVAMAMLSEATVYDLMHLIPRHPSIGEALVDAAMDVEKRSLHMPKW